MAPMHTAAIGAPACRRKLEWEFAARNRGDTDFPWGSQPPSCADVITERDPEDQSNTFHRCRNYESGLVDIGTGKQDRTLAGVWDMGGGVMEWVSDCYRAPSAITMSDNPLVESDENSGQCSFRVRRGGGWSGSLLAPWGSVDSKKNRMRPLAMQVSVARRPLTVWQLEIILGLRLHGREWRTDRRNRWIRRARANTIPISGCQINRLITLKLSIGLDVSKAVLVCLLIPGRFDGNRDRLSLI
ncbi:MAG: SUMF1/EgtB/PvdO family nonheme iron enzyme [Polyangia bacterium]